MTSGTVEQANIDVYPIEFNGIPLSIPCVDNDIISAEKDKKDGAADDANGILQSPTDMNKISKYLKDLKEKEKDLEIKAKEKLEAVEELVEEE